METSKIEKMKYLFFIFFLFFCCKSHSEYTLIRDNLYRDKNYSLYIKVIDNTSENNPSTKYISELYLSGKEKLLPLYKIIDKETYHQLEKTNYSKDKRYVYFLRETLEGGFFYILDSIPGSFRITRRNGVVYGISGEKHYYNGELIDKDSID